MVISAAEAAGVGGGGHWREKRRQPEGLSGRGRAEVRRYLRACDAETEDGERGGCQC